MDIKELISKAVSEGQLSFEDQLNEVSSAFFQWMMGLGDDDGWLWPIQTYTDHIIVEDGNGFARVGYDRDGDVFSFQTRSEWVPVNSEWTPVANVERTLSKGNALKALRKSDTELVVGNYMMLFGGRDLVGEYFTKSTKFDSPYTDMNMVVLDWEHGEAPKGEPDRHDLLGRVDWKTAQIDEQGLFVERILNRRSEYVEWLETLIEDGIIGNSSEAVGKGVRKADDGEITVWPIYRDTLTVTPMEPRMLGENSVAAIKALSQYIPKLSAVMAKSDEADRADSQETDRTSVVAVSDKSNQAMRLNIELDLLESSL